MQKQGLTLVCAVGVSTGNAQWWMVQCNLHSLAASLARPQAPPDSAADLSQLCSFVSALLVIFC
jgi:hypothetical protein